MVNNVEFPGLGLELTISRVAFTIFGIDVYWYGILIGIGMVLGVFLALRKARDFGVDPDRLIDVIFFGFVGAIVCGRLYYVLFVDSGIQYNTFWDVIDLRSGGLAIYGSIIGAVLGGAIGCKVRKVPLLPVLDLASMSFLVGQAIGRWGNFFNQEAFGGNTTGLLGMRSQTTIAYLQNSAAWLAEKGIEVRPHDPVHPTFLYESIWCIVGFALLWAYKRRRRFNGEIALFYVIWYGVGRFFIEGLRTDSLYIGGVRVSQMLAAASAVAALIVWLYCRNRLAGKPLVVPEIPPHTANVRLEDENGEMRQVLISWPAGERAPSREERERLAREVLEAEGPAEVDEEDVEAAEKAAAAQGYGDGEDEPLEEPEDGEDRPAPKKASAAKAAKKASADEKPAAAKKPAPKRAPAAKAAEKASADEKPAAAKKPAPKRAPAAKAAEKASADEAPGGTEKDGDTDA